MLTPIGNGYHLPSSLSWISYQMTSNRFLEFYKTKSKQTLLFKKISDGYY